FFFFFSSRRRHTRSLRDWSSDVCSSDLLFQKTHVNLELDDLRGLIFVAAGRLLKERFKTLARFRVIFLFERNVREIELRLAELQIGRASCREKCRTRSWRKIEKKKVK